MPRREHQNLPREIRQLHRLARRNMIASGQICGDSPVVGGADVHHLSLLGIQLPGAACTPNAHEVCLQLRHRTAARVVIEIQCAKRTPLDDTRSLTSRKDSRWPAEWRCGGLRKTAPTGRRTNVGCRPQKNSGARADTESSARCISSALNTMRKSSFMLTRLAPEN